MKTRKSHVLWFILIRLIAVTSILVAVVIIQHSTTDFIPLIPFYFLVAADVHPVGRLSRALPSRGTL